MSGAWLKYKKHKCKTCPGITFGQKQYCDDCSSKLIRERRQAYDKSRRKLKYGSRYI